jgi:hypothetical protein
MKMKILNNNIFYSLLVFSLINLSGSYSSAKNFGLGVLLFGPTSVSVQNYFDSYHSIDGALGWDFNHDNEIYLHSTYLIHMPNQFNIENFFFNLFYGVGAYIHNRKPESDLGCRMVFGSAYKMKSIPTEFFAEISANLNLVPSTEVLMMVGLGGRYYF